MTLLESLALVVLVEVACVVALLKLLSMNKAEPPCLWSAKPEKRRMSLAEQNWEMN